MSDSVLVQPADQLPIGTPIVVLHDRNEEGLRIPDRLKLTGKTGKVMATQVHHYITVRLDGGGIYHLSPYRVRVVPLKKAWAHG